MSTSNTPKEVRRPALKDASDEEILNEFKLRFPPARKAIYPLPLFHLLNEYRPSINIEAMVYRQVDEHIELLLRERSSDESYPNISHIAGGYMLQDETADEAVQRIVADEIGSSIKVGSIACAGILFDRHEARGPQLHVIFAVAIIGESFRESVGWYQLDRLPSNLVAHHRELIQEIGLPVITGEHQTALVREYVPKGN